MASQEQYPNPLESFIADIAVKLRDIEEKQNINKDRVIMIGENLVSEKEDTQAEISKLRGQMNLIVEEIRKIKMAIERIVEDSDNYVRKNEFQVLQHQFQMFQPMEVARISDVEEMIRKALKH